MSIRLVPLERRKMPHLKLILKGMRERFKAATGVGFGFGGAGRSARHQLVQEPDVVADF